MESLTNSIQIPRDFVVDIPVCTTGNEHSIHVHSRNGSQIIELKIYPPRDAMSCPMATHCLMKENLPVVSGTSISIIPDDLIRKLERVYACVVANKPTRTEATDESPLSFLLRVSLKV